MSLLDDPLLADVPVVDGYKVLEPCVLYAPVGRGGMGAVYRGRHLNLELDVAVKCLKASLAAEDPDFVTRFQREARVAAAVSDANLIRTYDVGKRHGVHYLVMEYVEGENLRDRVQRKGALPLDEALTIAIASCKGLAAAHASGVVHRDIKPGNILVSRSGRVKVADLGLAKAADSADSLATATHVVLGTPQYMPPEQFKSAKDVGPAGDVYALAATLWFMIEGRDAVAGGSLSEVMCRVVIDGFPSMRESATNIPPAIAAVIDSATRKEPSERYRDAAELAEALQEAASGLGLKASLADDEAGATRAVESMVSPPPVETLTRIQSAVESGHLGSSSDAGSAAEQPTVRSGEAPAAPAAPAAPTTPNGPSRVSRLATSFAALPARRRRHAGLALLLIGALGIVFCLLVSAGGAPDAGPRGAARNAPSALVPATDLQFYFGVHDMAKAHEAATLVARNVDDMGNGGGRSEMAEMMSELAEEVFGLEIPHFAGLAAAGIDTGAGMCFAAYWNDIQFMAFRVADTALFQRELQSRWEGSGYVLETAVRRGFQVFEQKNERGGWLRRAAVIDGDKVYYSPGAEIDRLIDHLVIGSEAPLDADPGFKAATGALVEDRTATLYFELPADVLADEPELQDLFAGFRGFAGSIRETDGAYEAEMRFDVDASSRMGTMVGNENDSLLGYFDTDEVFAAVELRLDRAGVMSWIDSNAEMADELRQADEEIRRETGVGLRSDFLDRLDGRVAWIVGRPGPGRITAFPDSEAQFETGRTRFPMRLDRELQRYVDRGGRPLSLPLPGTTLALGIVGDAAEVIASFEKAISVMAREDDFVAFAASGEPGKRMVSLSFPEQGVHHEFELIAHDGFVTVGSIGNTTPVSSSPYRGGTFGKAPRAMARGFLNTSAVGEWLHPVANNAGVDSMFRRMKGADPLVVDLAADEDGVAVGVIRLGPAHPFLTTRHPLWIWLSAALLAGGAALFVTSRRG